MLREYLYRIRVEIMMHRLPGLAAYILNEAYTEMVSNHTPTSDMIRVALKE